MKISKRTLKRNIRPDSKKLHCVSLGITKDEFNIPRNQSLLGLGLNERSREFKGNKVTIHFTDRTIKQFSFIPVIATKPVVQHAPFNNLGL